MTVPTAEGPGELSKDGCSVEVYATLRAGVEPDIIAAAVPTGGSILELGAGAGRVTRELLARGYSVVAVDDSAQMLAHIEGTETVLAGIEGLDLGRRFDAVLLGSHLINTSDVGQREAFVAACARHTSPGGCVVIERHAPEWFATAIETSAGQDGVGIALRDISRPGEGLLSATVEYRIEDRIWTQTFTAERVDDGGLSVILARHGLVIDRYLDDAGAWISAIVSTIGAQH
jgi:SAM-dependent methyltransferase